MRLSTALAASLVVAVGVANAQSQQVETSKVCLEGLKEAVRNFKNYEKKVNWERDYAKNFCDKLKTSQKSASESKLNVVIKAIPIGGEDKRSREETLDKEFCQNEKDRQKFSESILGWSYEAHPEALKDFNVCMATVNKRKKGVHWSVQTVGACDVTVLAAYASTSPENPTRAPVERFKPINLTCDKPPPFLSAQDQTISCRRQGWGPAILYLDTPQGPVQAEVDAVVGHPAPPVLPLMAARDTKEATQTLNWPSGPNDASINCPNRVCSGTISLPAGAEYLSTERVCTSHEINNNGHASCAWSLYAAGDGKPAANARFDKASNSVIWTRLMDAWSRWTEVYTVKYTVPHVLTDDEKAQVTKYEADVKAHELMLVNGPCPEVVPKSKVTRKVKG